MLFYKISLIATAILVQSRFLLIAALLYPVVLFYNCFNRKPVWLIGENEGRCLHDNGYFFYKFCRNNQPDRHIYFITNKKSKDNDYFLKNDEHIVIFGSIKHVIFFLLSTTLIYSHAQSDVGYIQIIKLFKRNCTRVFLQHGVIAFKQVHTTYRKKHNEMDIFIVTSNFEQKIILENFDFNENIVRITGLSRYDTLFKKTFSSQKSILYMPTWRDWAFPEKNAVQYLKGIKNLLNSKQLASLLRKYGIQFNFYIHDKMQSYLSDFVSNDKINIVYPTDKTVQSLIKENSLLITDYSSVAWDFYYLGRPVLFYQFDQEEYLARRGSYINFDNELFGEVFKESETLIPAIENYVVRNFAELPEFAEKRGFYFKFRDTNNCKRIFDVIISYNKSRHGCSGLTKKNQ